VRVSDVFDTKVLKASKNNPTFASSLIWQKRFTTPTPQTTNFNLSAQNLENSPIAGENFSPSTESMCFYDKERFPPLDPVAKNARVSSV
jgi:hypothetical protein